VGCQGMSNKHHWKGKWKKDAWYPPLYSVHKEHKHMTETYSSCEANSLCWFYPSEVTRKRICVSFRALEFHIHLNKSDVVGGALQMLISFVTGEDIWP
jgi:hypothetical protein